MARNSIPPRAPGTRLLLLVALFGVAVVAAMAFGRVFAGNKPALRLGLAAGISMLLAGLMERRNILLAVLVSAAGLAVAIGLLVFPETTRYSLPTMRTLRLARHAWATVGRTADTESAPALPLDPLFLAALTAVWTAAFSSHSLAARARSPFLALLPPSALLAFGNKVVEDGARPLYVGAFLLAAFTLLFADGLRRVSQWGPISMWHGRYGLKSGTATTTRGARRMAAACLGLALLAPGLLPGFRDKGLVDLHGEGLGLHISIDPLVDLRPALLSTSNVELFTVQSDLGSYWRFLTLDRFNGRIWTSTDLEASKGTELRSGQLAPDPDVPIDPGSTRELRQIFHLERLVQLWLPAASDPIGLQVNERIRYDPRSRALVAPDGTRPGLSYEIASAIPALTLPAEMDGAVALSGPGADPYLTLPENMPEEIAAIAHRWTDDQPNVYRKILAIQTHLRNDFRYDERVAPGHGVNDILNFLTETKAGYCEQFAGSMAVLLRALGIPARVAVGFNSGRFDASDGLFHVSTRDAHAWVEVPFPGKGWLAFEPTPHRRNPTSSAIDFPISTPRGGSNQGPQCLVLVPRGTSIIDQCDSASPAAAGGGRPPVEPTEGEPKTASPPPAKSGSKGKLALALGLLALILLMAVPVFKLARRRVALTKSHDPRRRILAAYGVLTDTAADVGLGRSPAETPREYSARLRTTVRFANGDLGRLTSLADLAAYSANVMGPEDAEAALLAARRTAKDIRRSAGLARVALGMFRVSRAGLLRLAAG
jgi:transglutaminase-like putative cysteine protease